jgi:hypothetical protein
MALDASLIVEKSFIAFFIVTVLLGGTAAFLSGRALARSWKSAFRLMFYMLLLGAAIRFLHWALFAQTTYPSWAEARGTLSLHYYIVDTVVLMAIAMLCYRYERAAQMTKQYNWLLKRTGPFTWKER